MTVFNVEDLIGVMDIQTGTSVILAVIAVISLCFNWRTTNNQRRLEQAINALKFHDKWWSEDYTSAREKVYNLVLDRKNGKGKRSQAFLDYQANMGSTQKDSEYISEALKDDVKAFTKVVFFFSDLYIYIKQELINEQLAYELFGDSQYAWFEEFIKEVRDIREKSSNYDSQNSIKKVRWIEDTKKLEKIFCHLRHKKQWALLPFCRKKYK